MVAKTASRASTLKGREFKMEPKQKKRRGRQGVCLPLLKGERKEHGRVQAPDPAGVNALDAGEDSDEPADLRRAEGRGRRHGLAHSLYI